MEKKTPSLLDHVKSDNKTTKQAFLILLGICLFIFLCNFRHIYNVFTGPHAVESVNLMKPGMKRFVAVDGPLRWFGTRQSSKTKKDVELGEGRETGIYYLGATSNASFIVFSEMQIEPPVSGRLTRFSKTEAESMPKSDRLSPWYVDAGQGKWYDTNLFMWVAVPLFFLLLPFFIMSLFSKPMEHAAIKRLAEWGDTDTLIREIDADMNRQPERVTKQCFCSNNWMILFWGMEIFRPQDIRSISLAVNEANKKVLEIVFHLVDGKEHKWGIKHNDEATQILNTLVSTYRTKCTAPMKALVRRLEQQQ